MSGSKRFVRPEEERGKTEERKRERRKEGGERSYLVIEILGAELPERLALN